MRMSRNWLIEVGVWLVVGSVLVWVGAELTRRVEWILPYTAAAGAALLVAGVASEFMRARRTRRS